MEYLVTKEDMKKALEKGLDGLHEIAAIYDKAFNESSNPYLPTYIIKGKYVISNSSCPSMAKMESLYLYNKDTRQRHDLPSWALEDIVTYEDLKTAMGENLSTGWSFQSPPKSDSRCYYCGKFADLETGHTFDSTYDYETKTVTYFHTKCRQRKYTNEFFVEVEKAFSKAGFPFCGINEIPNEYCSCDTCSQWAKVYTKFGFIKVGWRKRVINIDWSESKFDAYPSQITSDNVTKGEYFIHAYGYDKLQEYLKALLESSQNNA